jgi:hypothetical protein
MLQGQQVDIIDLTAPVDGPVKTGAEIAKEVLEFSMGQVPYVEKPLSPEEQIFPLELRLESLPAFDRNWATVVEFRLVNTGTKSLFLPLSGERRTVYGHPEDDRNRDYMSWGLRLRSASSEEAFIAAYTWRSSTDPKEALELRPNDPVRLRFRIEIDVSDREAAARSMGYVRRGEPVQAAVEIKRYVLKDFRPPEKGLRYQLYPQVPLLSNYVRVPPQ